MRNLAAGAVLAAGVCFVTAACAEPSERAADSTGIATTPPGALPPAATVPGIADSALRTRSGATLAARSPSPVAGASTGVKGAATTTAPAASVPTPTRPVPGAAAKNVRADSATANREAPVATATAGDSAGAARAAAPSPSPAPAAPSAFARALDSLPFLNGEKLEYDVKYGFIGVGRATLEVLGVDEIRGTPVVHTMFAVKGGVRVYRVDDRYESWFDPRTFTALRFAQSIDEGSYERERKYEIYPTRKTFTENEKPEEPSADEPLDEGSLIYFLRTLPLEVGKTYELNRYFRPDRNPVKVIVLRKDRVKVPAGEFNTIVVRPVIKAKGIFSEGGHAEAWLTDDSTRTLVQLKSDLKFGSLSLYLKRRTTGRDW